jgi:hypothetical protein
MQRRFGTSLNHEGHEVARRRPRENRASVIFRVRRGLHFFLSIIGPEDMPFRQLLSPNECTVGMRRLEVQFQEASGQVVVRGDIRPVPD